MLPVTAFTDRHEICLVIIISELNHGKQQNRSISQIEK